MLDLRDFVGLSGAPLVVAFVQICKRWVTDSRWWPVLALLFGVLLNEALAYVLKTDYATAAIIGLITGLVASGAYSQVKKVRESRGEMEEARAREREGEPEPEPEGPAVWPH